MQIIKVYFFCENRLIFCYICFTDNQESTTNWYQPQINHFEHCSSLPTISGIFAFWELASTRIIGIFTFWELAPTKRNIHFLRIVIIKERRRTVFAKTTWLDTRVIWTLILNYVVNSFWSSSHYVCNKHINTVKSIHVVLCLFRVSVLLILKQDPLVVIILAHFTHEQKEEHLLSL